MKKHLIKTGIILIAVMSIISCKDENEKRRSKFLTSLEELDYMIHKEVKHPENTKPTILNIPFLISESEYNNIIDSLHNTGKISKSEIGYYYYPFMLNIIDEIEVPGYISPEFHNDSLYSMTLFIGDMENQELIHSSLSSSQFKELVTLKIKQLYIQKLGSERKHFISIPSIIKGDPNTETWVFGNSKISVYDNYQKTTIVKYEYIPIVEQLEEIEQNIKRENNSKLIQDL